MTGGYLQFFQEDWIFILEQKYCFRRVSLRLQIKERKLFTLLLNIQILHSVQCSFEMLSLVILTLNQCGTKGVNLSGAYWTVRNQERSKSASKCIWRLKVKCLSSQARRQHAVATSLASDVFEPFWTKERFWTVSQGAHDVYRLRSFCRPFCSMVGRLKEGANSIATRPALCYRFGRRSVLVVKNIGGFQIWADDQESLMDNGRARSSSWRIDMCARSAHYSMSKVLSTANQSRRWKVCTAGIFTMDWRTRMNEGRCEHHQHHQQK